MNRMKTLLLVLLTFPVLFSFALDSYANNGRAERSPRGFRICADSSGRLLVKSHCSSSEQEVSLDYIQNLNAFEGELITPSGIIIRSTADSVSILTDENSILMDPIGGITLSSSRDINISTIGALNLEGASVSVRSHTNTLIQSDISTDINSNVTSSVSAGAIMEIQGSLVKIN
ncbi:MAG: hypothetical protein KDD70_16630 [Bdellovibrionales bacterium]|nr:hypothetical protein [Bdellovibrionales bacterium]